MNPQGRLVAKPDGRIVVEGGIEWLKRILPDGTELQGFTWNVVGGCLHRCHWVMPQTDGTAEPRIAQCYAKDVAETGVAKSHYPEGFEHHYFNPKRLREPLSMKIPRRIFPDSMADLLGSWVPKEQLEQVVEVMQKAYWHVFCLLTKNAPRYKKVQLPPNVWAGASTPPDFMWGHRLTHDQQIKMLERILEIFAYMDHPVKWLSIEPLSWDVAIIIRAWLRLHPNALQWVVIGAASDGNKTIQPDEGLFRKLIAVCDEFNIPVFFKGNLDREFAVRVGGRWREDFPANDPLRKFDVVESKAKKIK